MDKKSQFLYQFRAFFVNSNSIPIPFFSIPTPSPIPGIESGIELNSHSIPELTPTLVTRHIYKQTNWYLSIQNWLVPQIDRLQNGTTFSQSHG